MSYTLILKSPVLLAANEPHFIRDLTPNPQKRDEPMKARGWRRPIRGIEGYGQGEFSLYGDMNTLAHFFYEFMGYHLEERSGGYKTWEGMIYEMDLSVNGTTMRKTFDSMYNHVRVRYQDTDNNIQMTTAAEDAESQRRFGKRELIWPLTGQDTAAAEEVRDALLAEYSKPRARPTGMSLGTVGGLELFVRVCGYAYTANWQYESAGDDTDDDLSTWISEIITTNCPFLQVANIVSNATQVRKSNKREMRAWDVITKLLEMGLNSEPARAYVDNDRRFYYEQIDTSPQYFKRGGGFFSSPGANLEVSPWLVRPAVVRDLTYPVRDTEVGAWLSDARDAWLTEVEVWDDGTGKGVLVPKTEEYDESEIMTAQAAYKEELMRLRETESMDTPFGADLDLGIPKAPKEKQQTSAPVAPAPPKSKIPRWKWEQ